MKTEKNKTKTKIHKTVDSTWDTHTYSGPPSPYFNMEWTKYFNPVEGRDQIIFLYTDKKTKRIIKHRILR